MPKTRGVLAPKKYVCDEPGCKFRTDFSSSFVTHKQTAHGSNERKEENVHYFCRSCNVQAEGKRAWRQHIEGAKHRRAELTLNANIHLLTAGGPMPKKGVDEGVMYSKPSDIPFDEPGAVKKKKKPRMMVPDDLGDVVNAASARPRAVPVEAHQQEFDLMGLLDGYQEVAAQESPQQAPQPAPPTEPQPKNGPLPEEEMKILKVELQPETEEAQPSRQASTLSPSSPPFVPKKAMVGRPAASKTTQLPVAGKSGPKEILSAEVSQPPAVKGVPATKPTDKKAKRPTPTPWTSTRVSALKKEEARPSSPAQKCSEGVPESSNTLQRPSKPPGFNTPVQISGRQGFPGVQPGSGNAPKPPQKGGGGLGQAVEGLASQLEAAWPSLAPSKPTAGVAPEWVIRKISESQALKEAPTGNWPAAMLSSGPRKLGEVVQRAPTGNFGPIALRSTAAPSGLGQKKKSPAKPVAVAAFRLERPRPPKLLERLPTPVDSSGKGVDADFEAEKSGKTSAKSYDQSFADFFPESQAPPATNAAMPSSGSPGGSAAANLPPEEAYQDEVAQDAEDLPPPVDDETHLPSAVQEDWLCCPITMAISVQSYSRLGTDFPQSRKHSLSYRPGNMEEKIGSGA